MKKALRRQKGFTLIEVIVTIVLAALVGTVVFTYLGNILTRSHEPLGQVKDLAEAVAALEKFNAEYRKYNNDEITWDEFVAFDPAGFDGVGITKADVTATYAGVTMGVDFDIQEVTVTKNSQTIHQLFTER